MEEASSFAVQIELARCAAVLRSRNASSRKCESSKQVAVAIFCNRRSAHAVGALSLVSFFGPGSACDGVGHLAWAPSADSTPFSWHVHSLTDLTVALQLSYAVMLTNKFPFSQPLSPAFRELSLQSCSTQRVEHGSPVFTQPRVLELVSF